MPDLGTEIDVDNIEKSQFDLVPAGWYVACIPTSDVAVNKKGTGKLLKLRYDIIEGEYEGRVVFGQLSYQHDNPTAQKIAQQHIAAICEAVGHTGPFTNSEAIHDKPMMIKIVIIPAKDGYEAKNEVKGWKAIGAKEPALPVAKAMQGGGAGPAMQPMVNSAQQTVSTISDAPKRPWRGSK